MAEHLSRLQQRFWRLITAPSGVAKALPEESQRDPGISPVSGWIKGPDEEFSQSRLDIYANMYFYRLLDVMRADYPKIVALIGDAQFHNLVTDYLLACPSENPSLRYLGERFASFIKESPRAKEWPFLYDLAVLEWARTKIFDVEDETPIEQEALSEFPPEEWGDLVLSPIVALDVIHLAAPVHRVWLAIEEGETPPTIEAGPWSVLLWRTKNIVYHRPLSSKEASALVLLQERAPFSLLCECLEEPNDEIAETATRALQLISRWLQEGLIADAKIVPQEEE